MSKVYTYAVNLVVQVVSEDIESVARESLEANGGYVTKRTVKLLNTTDIEQVGVEPLLEDKES
jgi:hypothetical protein